MIGVFGDSVGGENQHVKAGVVVGLKEAEELSPWGRENASRTDDPTADQEFVSEWAKKPEANRILNKIGKYSEIETYPVYIKLVRELMERRKPILGKVEGLRRMLEFLKNDAPLI